MAPIISVILPVFNAEQHVWEAVESILAQDEPDFELIALNDGSTDNSLSILEALARRDRRIRLVDSVNKGLVATLNMGVRMARGTYLARMDADDVSMPNRFRLQLRYFEKNPDCLALGTAVELIDENGNSIRVARYPTDSTALHTALLSGCVIAHPSVMMRREAVLRVHGYRGALSHAEDYDLWLRLMEVGRLNNLPDPLLRYRQHEGQVSRRKALNQTLSTALARILHEMRTSGLEEPKLGEHPINLGDINKIELPPSFRAQLLLAGVMASKAQFNAQDIRFALECFEGLPKGHLVSAGSFDQLMHLTLSFIRRRNFRFAHATQSLMWRQSPIGSLNAVWRTALRWAARQAERIRISR